MEAVPTKTLLDEILDFLVSEPGLEQMAEFKPSDAMDARMQYLMTQNSKGTLSDAEQNELSEHIRLGHFVNMLKVRAKKKLAGK